MVYSLVVDRSTIAMEQSSTIWAAASIVGSNEIVPNRAEPLS